MFFGQCIPHCPESKGEHDHMHEKNVTLLITGAVDSIPSAKIYLNSWSKYQDCTFMTFRLPYTPPYERFKGIREYQYATRYRPFQSQPRRACVVILDISEWIQHTEDEYLRLFLKYLHDENGFYCREYLMTVGRADEQSIRNFRLLAAEYLGGGQVVYDRTLCDRNALRDYLQKNYPLNEKAADRLAQIYLSRPIRSIDTVDTITHELLACVDNTKDRTVTVRMLTDWLKHRKNTKIHLFYSEEIQRFLQQRKPNADKEECNEKYSDNGLPR